MFAQKKTAATANNTNNKDQNNIYQQQQKHSKQNLLQEHFESERIFLERLQSVGCLFMTQQHSSNLVDAEGGGENFLKWNYG